MNLVRLPVAAALLLTAAVRVPAFLAAAPNEPTAAGAETHEPPPVAELTARLRDEDAPSAGRAEAARALGRLGAEGLPAVKALEAASGSGDEEVALAALEALCRLDAPEGLSRLREILNKPEGRAGNPANLESIRDALVPQLIELSLSAGAQGPALYSLGPRRGEAFAALRRGLDSSTPEMRRTAAVGLRQLGPDAAPALPRLLKALTDPDPGVCLHAAAAAWEIGRRPEGVSVLAAGLRRPEPDLRIAAAIYLAQVGEDAGPATPDLVEALDDPVRAVRERAVFALRCLGRRAQPDLAAGLRSGGLQRRRLALDVLAAAGAPPGAAEAVRAALQDADGQDRPGRRPGLDLSDGEFRVRAVRLLSELEPARRRELPPLLLPALRDPASVWYAVDLLRELGPDARVVSPELTALLSDPDPEAALAGAAALAAAAPERAEEGLPAVRSALRSGDRNLRYAALLAGIRLGPAARPMREELLARLAARVLGKEEGDWDIDLELLIRIGAEADALPLLIQALRSDSEEVGENAESCLRRIGKDAAPSLRGVLESDSPAAVQRARRVLKSYRLLNKW
jgi:HEAT repeat protein